MKTRYLLTVSVGALLLLAAVLCTARVARRLPRPVVDLSGYGPASLDPATRDLLQTLPAPLVLTYFVSDPAHMPSAYQGLEERVRTLLAALRAVAPDQVRYRVLYPDLGGRAGVSYAAQRGVHAVSVPRVAHDEHDQQSIWSALVIDLGRLGTCRIPSIRPQQVQDLEGLVRSQIQSLIQPPRPVFGLAAPPGYATLEHWLQEHGRVQRLDLEGGEPLDRRVDLLFWVQPGRVGARQVRRLQAFLASGRSAVLAGSTYDLESEPSAHGGSYRVRLHASGWADLLRPFGLTPVRELVLDQSTGPLRWDGATLPEAPFMLRCLPRQCDLHGFAAPARGGLSFAAASALEVDPGRVRRAGYRARTVVTSTEATRVLPLSAGEISAAQMDGGQPVGQRGLAVLLQPQDPLAGRVLVLGSASLLRDGILDQPGYAHRVFLDNVLRTLAGREQIAVARAPRRVPSPLEDTGLRQRLVIRVMVVGLVPALLLAAGLRPLLRGRSRRRPAAAYGVALVALGFVLAAAVGRTVQALPPAAWDLTRERVNTPSAWLRRMLRHRVMMHDPEHGLQVELIVSPRAFLPVWLADVESRLRLLLRDTGVDLRVVRVPPAGPDFRGAPPVPGLEPISVEQVWQDSLRTRSAWCGLRLRSGARTAVVPRLDRHALDHLEFLLGAALERLAGVPAPRIAVIAPPPRLSPAEELQDYYRRGLMPPGGTDVFAELEERLQDYGYQVRRVSLRDPHLEDPRERVLWLQPRRDSTPVAAQVARLLHDGGRVLVAVQHFQIQQRQYRGTGFRTVYWPQPQFQDIDSLLHPLGVTQVREVLMDRTCSHLVLDTQIHRGEAREYDAQEVALPFLIRVVDSGMSSRFVVTRNLGDLLFAWGNRFRVEEATVRRWGLRVDTLATTSDQAWSYAWAGGWLPPQALRPTHLLPGPQPLILKLEGKFPLLTARREPTGAVHWDVDTSAAPGSRAGELVLVGCSVMFQNGYLDAPGYDHDQLLLNLVSWLCHGPRLTELQARESPRRGFPHLSAASKQRWRLAVTLAGPLAYAAFGVGRSMRRRRRRRAGSMPGGRR